MNVNIDNLEHALMTIDGFESLSNGDYNTPDSIYAKTVLKLNGVDFKHRTGTEGFMSTVQDGAGKIYEMIKNFIKAIRDFFKGLFGKKVDNGVSNAAKSVEKSIAELTVQIPKLELSEATKNQVQEINQHITDKIESLKKKVVDAEAAATAQIQVEKFNQQLEKRNEIAKTKVADRMEKVVTESWEGSYTIKFMLLMLCDKSVFEKTVKNLDLVAADYNMKAMCVSTELKEARGYFERLNVKNINGGYEHVIDNLKEAKNTVGILNVINTQFTDSIVVLNDLLDTIIMVIDENKKHNVANKLINKDLRMIMGIEQGMVDMKSHFAKVVLEIESQIKKIEKVVLKKEISPQSEKIRQDCIDALGHLPD